MPNFAEFKRFFLFNLIGSLILCAVVAVITVLIGNFTQTTTRVLFTLFMVIVHSLVSLSFIWDDERKNTFEKLQFFTNVLFLIIVLSFITSIFGIWSIISGSMVWHLYQTFFVIGFAALHGDILAKAIRKESYIDKIVFANYIVMIAVVLMLLPLIYSTAAFGEFYYRLLGALGIIDGTLSILTIIFFKLYMHKHPNENSPLVTTEAAPSKEQPAVKKQGLSMWVWVLIIYLVFQVGSVAYVIMSSLAR